MPRQSYEAHRAAKLGVGTRRPSVVESETDAESLTSYTTLQSHASSSSYLPRPQHINPSTSASPSPRLASFSSQSGASHAHLRPSYRTFSSADAQGVPSFASRTGSPSSPLGPGSLRERALSSSSSQYRPFAPPLPLGDGTSALGLTVPLAEHGRRSSATSADEREKRRKRREERRAEKAERSTLKGEGYDSPLRRFIRGLSVREKSRWGLPIGLAAAGGVKVLVAAVVCYVGDGELNSEILVKLALEATFWWSAVIAWNVSEGRRTGRSWRTQLTGILTVLLHPALILLEATSTRSLSVPLGLSLWSIVLLSKSWDVFAAIPLAVAASDGGASWWWLLPASGAYVLGNSIILGGRKGLRRVSSTISVLSIATALASGPRPQAWTSRGINAALRQQIVSLSSALDPRTLATSVSLNIYMMLGLMSLVPSLAIQLYASLSLRRQSTVTHPPVTFRLLLPALLASTLGLYLSASSSRPADTLALLLPMLAMMSLRGGQEGQGEAEAWDLGALFTCLACINLMPGLERSAAFLVMPLVFLWTWTIGFELTRIQTSWIRRMGLITLPLMVICVILPPFTHSLSRMVQLSPAIPLAVTASCALGMKAIWLATAGTVWLWAHRKLLESSWGIAGLGLSGDKRK